MRTGHFTSMSKPTKIIYQWPSEDCLTEEEFNAEFVDMTKEFFQLSGMELSENRAGASLATFKER